MTENTDRIGIIRRNNRTHDKAPDTADKAFSTPEGVLVPGTNPNSSAVISITYEGDVK